MQKNYVQKTIKNESGIEKDEEKKKKKERNESGIPFCTMLPPPQFPKNIDPSYKKDIIPSYISAYLKSRITITNKKW